MRRGNSRIHGVDLERAEAEQECEPLRDLEALQASVDIAQQKIEREQEKESAQNLVISRRPGHHGDQRSVRSPEDRGPESRRRRTGDTPRDGLDEGQVGELRRKQANPERQCAHAEQSFEAHEEGALTPGADGSLRQRSEHRLPKVMPIVYCCGKPEPGEIILAEPALETVPVESEAEQRRDGPGGEPPGPGHFASSPTEVAITPNSRSSIAPAGMNLSRLNSTLTDSSFSSLASTLRT